MPQNRTAVVTGGLGRSGQWIADHLAEEDWQVVCTTRPVPDRGQS